MSNTKKNKVRYNPFSGLGGAGELNKAEKNAGSVEEAAFLSPDRTGRLAAVMRKAASGDKVVICVLGGSITEGSGASDGEYYGDNLYAWFKKRFPDGDFEYHNVGRGTTTSLFGSARIERDLAPLKPDLIVVEYAVKISFWTTVSPPRRSSVRCANACRLPKRRLCSVCSAVWAALRARSITKRR